MKIHLCALPQVRLGTASTHLCAYSGKIVKFCKMMGRDYEIIVYAPESDPIQGATLVDCLSDEGRQAIFGKDSDDRLPNWPTDEQSLLFNGQVISKMRDRIDGRDLILLSGGWTHKPIFDAFPAHIKFEGFCGYQGILSPFQNVSAAGSHVAFESYFHMAQVYQRYGINDIRWYDRCIPPFVDSDEFPRVNQGNGEYLLFLGRLILRKGPHIALQIAEACKLPLIIAGAGGHCEDKTLVGLDVKLSSDKIPIQYMGPVGIEQRAILMANARAFLCPTTYFEPGANVAIESQMAGTPVICPDSGVFAETVQHGTTGYHFRTLRQAVEGVRNSHHIAGEFIRSYAEAKYSLGPISRKYMMWFEALQELWESGWNTL